MVVNHEPGVMIVDVEMIDEFLREARGSHVATFVLSTHRRVGRDAFFGAIREALPLDPPLVGSRSWDALADSLWEGLRKLEASRIAIVWRDATDFGRNSPGEYQLALSILQDITETIIDPFATNGRPKSVTVYIGSVGP